MTDQEKIIRDLATLTEQGRWSVREFHEIKSDVKDIKTELYNLNSFRWKTIGFSAAISFVVGLMAAVGVEIARAKG